MKLEDSKTFINLAKDFAGECQARTRYKFVEYGARNEGLNCLAEVIDKVVYNEFNHARMFYTYIQKVTNDKALAKIEFCADYPYKQKWDLQENLRISAEDEFAEFSEIYPAHQKIAKEEGFEDIAKLYEYIIGVENCHHLLFKDFYEQVKNGTLYKKTTPVKWKCVACGFEHESEEAWKVCPLCFAKQGMVMLHLKDE